MPPVRNNNEYTLFIRLAEIEPAIWRRIVAPGQLTLHQFSHLLQVTMGWTHSHLHQFSVPGANESTYYGEPSPEDDYFHKDDRLVRLAHIAPKKGATFLYEYDFGGLHGDMRSPLRTSTPPRRMSRRIHGVWMDSGPVHLKTWAVSAGTSTFWKRGASGAIQSIRKCDNGWGSVSARTVFGAAGQRCAGLVHLSLEQVLTYVHCLTKIFLCRSLHLSLPGFQ